MVRRVAGWMPDPAQMRLMPPVSGNAVNGLGERVRRRARHVYWATEPATIPHGDVQLWFYRRNDHPAMNAERARRQAAQARVPAPVAAIRPDRSPAEWAAAVKAAARRLGADAVGIARLDPAWVFEGRTVAQRFIVVLGIAMDHAELDTAPDMTAAVEVMRQYTRGVTVARDLCDWLAGMGVAAVPETGPMANDVNLIPAALAAGLGELGRHGSVINRALGASFRLASVLTDLDMVPDAPDDFGADGFCTHCRLCTDACPPGAIRAEKQWVRGDLKWYVDFDRCLPFFNETAGCAICLAVCPFSNPATGPGLVAKLERRRGRRATGLSPPDSG
jgi:ferredoxin